MRSTNGSFHDVINHHIQRSDFVVVSRSNWLEVTFDIYEKDHRLQYIIIYTAIKRIENNNTRYDGFSYYRRRYNADGYG